VLEGMSEFINYLIDIVERRRHSPGDDLISTLIRAEEGETALTPIEVVMFTQLLLVAEMRPPRICSETRCSR
jgi:cytochrome P450